MTKWVTSETNGAVPRAVRFLRKPWQEKARSASFRWARFKSRWTETFANIRLPVRLQFDAWWVPRNDNLTKPLLANMFETAEMGFVGRFVKPGMTVLDLGAHHGLYTLLASKRVGSRGRVISFEPSRRERRALRLHLALNRCQNVTIQGLALGDENAEADFYIVEARVAGCNSLKPPDVPAATVLRRVRVVRLDDWLSSRGISRVDFIKLDVEGGELAALKGAAQLLERKPRPVILAEVQDVRTAPWGYPAREIIEHLRDKGYKWFRLVESGVPEDLDVSGKEFEGNFVACPEEREAAMLELAN
jgi:FkbM family methyltransferase